MNSVIELLKNDSQYYDGIGKQYLSNSDINALLKSPKEFKANREDCKAFAEGRYFHQLILEPEKAKSIVTINASSRNTNIYKKAIEGSSETVMLLQKEAEAIEELVGTMTSNLHFYDLIYDDSNEFEVPAVRDIMGHMWKGKADIVGSDLLIDIKTTSDITQFRWNAKEYNYDSQCFIYQELFAKPLIFLVIDKMSGMLGEFIPTEEFVKGGADKVARAVKVYEKFFNEATKTDDIDSFYISENI